MSHEMDFYKTLTKMSDSEKLACKKAGFDVNKAIEPLKEKFDKKYDVIEPDQTLLKDFNTHVLANNNSKFEKALKNFDFTKYSSGLPLKYSRNDFVANVNKILDTVSPQDKQILLKHFGFEEGVEGFEGVLNTKEFVSAEKPELNTVAKQISQEIENFTTKNEVKTGDKEMDEILTSLVRGCPEFTTVIGKKQHGTQAYSVDVHTLKVLQSAMNNPLYKDLSDIDKTALKYAALLHDLGKKGGVVDNGHANKSSDYTMSILNKLKLSDTLKSRIINIVNDHHWFAAYNQGQMSAMEVASICRRKGQFDIYQIIAKADLENVNDNFYMRVTGTKSQKEFNKYFDKKMEEINDTRRLINMTSSLVNSDKIVKNGELFDTVQVQRGEKSHNLKVLNLNEMSDNTSLTRYGFSPDTTVSDFATLVHMTGSAKDLETALHLASKPKEDFNLSLTLASKNGNQIYGGKFGLVAEAEQANIVDADNKSLQSGYQKGRENTAHSYEIKTKFNRSFVRDKIKENLRKNGVILTDGMYLKLSEALLEHQNPAYYKDGIRFGLQKISGTKLRNAVRYARQELLKLDNGAYCNEISADKPRATAMYANVKNIDECPDWFIELAEKYNLPILIMQNKVK